MDFNDFPDFLVASFLSQESRFLLAVAVTAPSTSWRCGGGSRPKPSAKILVGASLCPDFVCDGAQRLGDEWKSFDFGNLQLATGKRYAPFGGSLDNDDLRAVLLCIDAANNVESLKLTRCYNITGRGLEPLRGSKTLERIDLSLVGE